MRETPLAAAVAVARALGHPARLRVAAVLRSGELCVCQGIEVLALAPSTVSVHLKELKRSGVVVDRKEGRWVYVRLALGGAASQVVDAVLAAVADDPTIAEDARLVEELRHLPVEDLCRLGLAGARSKAADDVVVRSSECTEGECP